MDTTNPGTYIERNECEECEEMILRTEMAVHRAFNCQNSYDWDSYG